MSNGGAGPGPKPGTRAISPNGRFEGQRSIIDAATGGTAS